MPERLELCAAHLAEIIAHCRREAPNEGCGLVSGTTGRASRVWTTRNSLASPTAYLIAPEDQLAAILQMRAAGEELLAIFHSHPATPAYPSARDVAEAYYPEVFYLIVSLRGEPEARAYRIVQGGIEPVELVIRPDPECTAEPEHVTEEEQQ